MAGSHWRRIAAQVFRPDNRVVITYVPAGNGESAETGEEAA